MFGFGWKMEIFFVLFVFIWVERLYEVIVYMGDVRGVGINVNVFLVMYGEIGKLD